MLFDFMKQIMSSLKSLEDKVGENQQSLDRVLKKIEKRKACRKHLIVCKLLLLSPGLIQLRMV